jgi:hypothetical protein
MKILLPSNDITLTCASQSAQVLVISFLPFMLRLIAYQYSNLESSALEYPGDDGTDGARGRG